MRSLTPAQICAFAHIHSSLPSVNVCNVWGGMHARGQVRANACGTSARACLLVCFFVQAFASLYPVQIFTSALAHALAFVLAGARFLAPLSERPPSSVSLVTFPSFFFFSPSSSSLLPFFFSSLFLLLLLLLLFLLLFLLHLRENANQLSAPQCFRTRLQRRIWRTLDARLTDSKPRQPCIYIACISILQWPRTSS
mmetsp:Transcript_3715/g.7149  ORF Transcript_3715/g.7149 Transcript_3715/m.7149 type:complete len:196 (+) Transcript_3715:100-687(+)